MEYINYVLKFLGFSFTYGEDTNPVVGFCIVVIMLSLVMFLAFVNVLICFGVTYVTDKPELKKRLPKHWLFIKIFNLYKLTRWGYLIYDIGLFLFAWSWMIYFCVRLIVGLS